MNYQLLIIILALFASCDGRVKQANKRGMAYIKQNMYDQAITEFNDGLTANDEWFPLYYNRAIAYANTNRDQEALKDFNYILATYPDHAESYFNRGILHENMGAYADAIQDYTETIKLRPDFIMAYHYRGIARFRMNDYDGALTDYNKALELGQGISMEAKQAKEIGLNACALYFNRGVVMQKKGNYEAAIKDYTEVIQIDPSSAKAYYNRAIAEMATLQMEEALKDLEIAGRLGETRAEEIIKTYFKTFK